MNGWFSRVNPQTGQVASGAGEVFVEGRSLGFGHLFDWFDAQTLLVKGDGDRPTLINIHTGERHDLSALPAVHAAAGGGAWMASRDGIIWCSVSRFAERAWIEEHAGSNDDRSLYLDGVPLVQHQPINYCHVDDGHVTWSLFLRGKREVWGCRPGHAPERLDVYAGDSLFCLPVVTPHGAWVVVQSHTALHVAPWGESRGTLIHTGNDNNFHPHAAWTPAGLLVVWNDSRGQQGRQLIDLSRRDDLSLPVPPPPPEPDPMPDVQVPDRSRFVHDFLAPKLKRLGTEEETRAHSFEMVNGLCIGLRHEDKRWGLLEKRGGDRVRDRAADVLLYKISDDEAQVVDVVSDAEGHDGAPGPAWEVKDIRSISQWKEPFPASGEEPAPGPEPTGKHAYWRDDNERDECSVVMSDMTQCDRPRADPIHQVSTPPDEPIPGDVTLALLLAEIKRLQNHLGVR